MAIHWQGLWGGTTTGNTTAGYQQQSQCGRCGLSYYIGSTHSCPTAITSSGTGGLYWGQPATQTTAWPPAPIRYTKLTVTPECVILSDQWGNQLEIALDVLRELLDYPSIEAKACMEALKR